MEENVRLYREWRERMRAGAFGDDESVIDVASASPRTHDDAPHPDAAPGYPAEGHEKAAGGETSGVSDCPE